MRIFSRNNEVVKLDEHEVKLRKQLQLEYIGIPYLSDSERDKSIAYQLAALISARGAKAYDSGKRNLGERDMMRAINISPQNLTVRSGLLTLLIAEKRYLEAVYVFHSIPSGSLEDEQPTYLEADLFIQAGDLFKCAGDYKTAIKAYAQAKHIASDSQYNQSLLRMVDRGLNVDLDGKGSNIYKSKSQYGILNIESLKHSSELDAAKECIGRGIFSLGIQLAKPLFISKKDHSSDIILTSEVMGMFNCFQGLIYTEISPNTDSSNFRSIIRTEISSTFSSNMQITSNLAQFQELIYDSIMEQEYFYIAGLHGETNIGVSRSLLTTLFLERTELLRGRKMETEKLDYTLEALDRAFGSIESTHNLVKHFIQ